MTTPWSPSDIKGEFWPHRMLRFCGRTNSLSWASSRTGVGGVSPVEVDKLPWMLASAQITTQDSALPHWVILVPKGQMLQWEKNNRKQKKKKTMAINECNRIMMWAGLSAAQAGLCVNSPCAEVWLCISSREPQCKEQTIGRPDRAKNPGVGRSAWNNNVETSG